MCDEAYCGGLAPCAAVRARRCTAEGAPATNDCDSLMIVVAEIEKVVETSRDIDGKEAPLAEGK